MKLSNDDADLQPVTRIQDTPPTAPKWYETTSAPWTAEDTGKLISRLVSIALFLVIAFYIARAIALDSYERGQRNAIIERR